MNTETTNNNTINTALLPRMSSGEQLALAIQRTFVAAGAVHQATQDPADGAGPSGYGPTLTGDDGSEAGSECSQASSRCLATLVPPLP